MARMKGYSFFIESDELYVDAVCGGDRLEAVFQKAKPVSIYVGFDGVQMFLFDSPFKRNQAFDEARMRFLTACFDAEVGILDIIRPSEDASILDTFLLPEGKRLDERSLAQ